MIDLTEDQTRLVAEYAADLLLSHDRGYENRLQEGEEDSVQQDDLFTILWTRKEALAKCLDLPLEQVCAQVDVSGTLRSRPEQCWANDMTQTDEIALRQNSVYVRSFFLQDVVLSVASLRESTVVPQEMWWNGADSIDFH